MERKGQKAAKFQKIAFNLRPANRLQLSPCDFMMFACDSGQGD